MIATGNIKTVGISQTKIGNEIYYKISNNDLLRPFFMSIVSDSNHWMFISSNGGLSAGRKNAAYALFPYYTDDKITEAFDITGSKSIFQIQKNNSNFVWEPFSNRYEGRYEISRNLYKNSFGNKVLFEEVNHDLALTFSYEWNSSNQFGFVKKSRLINHSGDQIKVKVLDGIQNILPYGVHNDLQNGASNLVDAYKKNELEKETGLGIYSLSAIIVDRAEPSEALKANIAWSLGLSQAQYLISSLQLDAFRKQSPIQEEQDIRAEKGAYFVVDEMVLSPLGEKKWMIVANVNQDHAAVAQIMDLIQNEKDLQGKVNQDIELGTKELIALNASADALQLTSDHLRDTRHFSNTLFNIMRGGIIDHNYQIEKSDLSIYLAKANSSIVENKAYQQLPEIFNLSTLKTIAHQSEDTNFRRLCLEYLPLKYSRRHGDPSRPWNKFSINTRSEIDGSKILDYEGNWRDIFQNWEALAFSFPDFIESMIHKFLNATTFDGYNPYRVTKSGFDWETIEPDDPWSYIGYWGDHQIIYLLKFLEFIENYAPEKLAHFFDKPYFVYANVPYKIKSYEDIVKNPKDTVVFDHDLDQKIRLEKEKFGADAALMKDENQSIYTVNFIEKILATVLAKLSNFIPEGGIWMNTQRPEWNDANNALVGNGVSMVTLYYLRRFLNFLHKIIKTSTLERVEVSNELIVFYRKIIKTFEKHESLLNGKINDENRKQILDELGQAGSDYRQHIYKQNFWGEKRSISISGLIHFVELSLKFIDHSIRANKRTDNLYHAYNLMTSTKEGVKISYLSEMLEGQVAVLSAGCLSSTEVLTLLNSLRKSKLYRADQHSYILYPNKKLSRFTNKNTIAKQAIEQSKLLSQLVANGNTEVIIKDIKGDCHFNGNFKNADDLEKALNGLDEAQYSSLLAMERQQVLDVFENIFDHKSFTGRSGTFFGYEGLGSIYWHMVSKLQLAVQACCLEAINNKEDENIVDQLIDHYYEINKGIGVHKSPTIYGAFPTDPYSHTPAGKGAQQPGMTGQVKEDVICRFGELGVFIQNGKLHFNPCLLRRSEFLQENKTFKYLNVHSENQELSLEQNSLCFTYCQIPVVYTILDSNSIRVKFKDGHIQTFDSLTIDQNISKEVFERTGNIVQIIVGINEKELR